MRFWVGITDYDWYSFLASRPELPEVNFWQPTARRRPAALTPGIPSLFKLHAGEGGRIVGGGFFATYSALPARLAWETFGIENGAATFEEMLQRVARYRHHRIDIHADQIGCLVLGEPFFFNRDEWIAPPKDWAPNIVQGKWYDSEGGEGARIWTSVQLALARQSTSSHRIAEERYGKPLMIQPRLGQGGFRLLVTDAYERRCAITGERTLPVLDAAHIKPYSLSGEHRVDNGLLLRKDLHALFDAGYVTVTPAHEVRVSRRIREEFENGRDYYALAGHHVRLPMPPNPPPSPEYLEWHGDMVFRG